MQLDWKQADSKQGRCCVSSAPPVVLSRELMLLPLVNRGQQQAKQRPSSTVPRYTFNQLKRQRVANILFVQSDVEYWSKRQRISNRDQFRSHQNFSFRKMLRPRDPHLMNAC